MRKVIVSAPGKIHLLGEHSVVYGKPALLTTINLRATATVTQHRNPLFEEGSIEAKFKKIVEPIVQKKLKLKKMPFYELQIASQIPLGSGLGSSATISSAYIGALLTYLRVTWNKDLINELTFQAERVFQGNPSGGDNSTVIYGGLIWFRKETPNLKLIQPLEFSISPKLSKNFILINTGRPQEITAEMVEMVNSKFKVQNSKFQKIFDHQEQLVKELLPVLKDGNEKEFLKIIRMGQKNLETIGVVSKKVLPIIRQIEKIGGAAKISGAGGKADASGILLCYHPNPLKLISLAKKNNLDYFKTKLGVEGVRNET